MNFSKLCLPLIMFQCFSAFAVAGGTPAGFGTPIFNCLSKEKIKVTYSASSFSGYPQLTVKHPESKRGINFSEKAALKFVEKKSQKWIETVSSQEGVYSFMYPEKMKNGKAVSRLVLPSKGKNNKKLVDLDCTYEEVVF